MKKIAFISFTILIALIFTNCEKASQKILDSTTTHDEFEARVQQVWTVDTFRVEKIDKFIRPSQPDSIVNEIDSLITNGTMTFLKYSGVSGKCVFVYTYNGVNRKDTIEYSFLYVDYQLNLFFDKPCFCVTENHTIETITDNKFNLKREVAPIDGSIRYYRRTIRLHR